MSVPGRARALLALGLFVSPAEVVGQQVGLVLTDITAAAGIDWVQTDNFAQMGAACAFLDYDRDSWLDVLLAGGFTPPALYRNQADGTFGSVSQASFFAVPSPPRGIGDYTCCATVADFDNDGDPDVFFGRWGPNLLFRNDGGGTFTDVTTPELAGSPTAFTTTAAFGDYDADGVLDLFVGNYIREFMYPDHTPEPNVLLHGNGDGTFQDVTDPLWAGAGTALASAWTDVDRDGDVDLMCANDFGAFIEPNQLYRNDGPGGGQHPRFTASAVALGLDLQIFCMGIAVGDFDRDGDFDYYYTNLGRNVLLRNDGPTLGFLDVTTASGTELTTDPLTFPPLLATSWGTGFHDFDNDGWLDLYVSNGHIPAVLDNGDATSNTLFRHDGASMTFTTMPGELDRGVGRGVAFGDFDNDGDVDVLQGNVGGSPRLLRNDSHRAADAAHWLQLELRGRLSNRDAIGAQVDVDVESFTACREVRRNDSFESSSDPRLSFGLGAAIRARSVSVRWPTGVAQQLYGVPVDRRLQLVEPVVTVEDPRISTIALPTFGTLIVFQARLVNHGQVGIEAAYVPQIWVESPGWLPAVAWSGLVRQTTLSAAASREVFDVHFLPAGVAVPESAGLDHVWIAADRGAGLDQARTRIQVP